MPTAVNTDQEHLEILARYQRAQQLEQGIYSKSLALNTTVYPHWLGASDRFWYVRDSRDGHRYRLVDTGTGSNEPAFDHQALATALTQATGESLTADTLPFSALAFHDGDQSGDLSFVAFDQSWSYCADTQQCQPQTSDTDNPFDKPQDSHWLLSPDGQKAAFTRDYNLWVKDLNSGEEAPLTTDGERFREYATAQGLSLYGKQSPSASIEARWSPDSKRLFTLVIDLRDVAVAPPLVEHVPSDGQLRPQIREADRRVAFVGDAAIEAWQLLSIELDTGSVQFVDYPPCPVMYPPYLGYFSSGRGWWSADSRYAYFTDQPRGAKQLKLVQWDTHTGKTRAVIEETSAHCVTLTPITHLKPLLKVLVETNELIWWSERSGWGHLYRYDLTTGELRNPITQGDWVVRNVLHFDRERRELWIQTAGRVPERNPYYCDICRVNIDTGELTPVLSTDHDYVVCDGQSRISAGGFNARGVSPNGQYLVATRSRVDLVPETLLLDRDGERLTTLEKADVSALPDGAHWPEPVLLTAADGHTTIHGVVFRPSNFDPEQSYPILDCSYQYATPVGSFTNNPAGSRYYLGPWAYAELGFIAVAIFNRGNDGLRDVAFNTYQNPDFPLAPAHSSRCYKNDVVAGMQQLAQRYSYMDIHRVGVIDFGSVPSALMGLLVHPDVYHVGVSLNAMSHSQMEGSSAPVIEYTESTGEANTTDTITTDKNGLPEFEQRADQLQGKLLLIHGMLDWCMPVAMTFRMMEALQQANKRFDCLLLPNLEHGSSSYSIQRSWDYVVEHLLKREPPKNFKLKTGLD